MTSEISDQHQAVEEQLDAARQEQSALEAKLDAVDGELASLSALRHRYELVGRICGSLDELRQLGAEALFWGEGCDPASASGPVRQARERLGDFESQVSNVEERRREIVLQLQSIGDHVEVLDYDLADLREQEETRKAEWVVEREEDALPYRAKVMPWTRGTEEDRRFRRTLAGSMAASLLLALLLPLIDLPILERAELVDVPERVARLIERERQVPPPRPAVEEPPEPEPLEPEPEPLLAEDQPQPVTQPAAEAPEAPPESAAERVQSKGILAFRESFANQAGSLPAARLGSQASLGNTGEASVGRPQRSMVTTMAPGSSGGINLASISRNVGGAGGGQLAGVQVTQVASSIGGGGGADRPLAAGQDAGRTDEEIQIVFDRYKSALYRLYNRELRRDPTLRGQIVVRLTIEPDGSVSMCRLETSDMGAPDLAQQVLERIRGFDFGAKDVVAMTIIYPIDFLPAA
jgi:outer membrane biosynthesis protein TonB